MFDAYVSHHARLRPDAPAIVTPGGVIGFARLDVDVARTSALLRQLEAGADRPVAVDVQDLYLHWVVTLALARLGVPSAPAADGDCPLRVADHAGAAASYLIGEREIAAMLSGPVPVLPRPKVAPEGLGRIMLSSGTTGAEKRIALSWAAIDAGIRNVPVAYGAASGPWLMATGVQTILGFVLTLGCWGLGAPVLMGLGGPLPAAEVLATRPGLIAMTPGQLARFLDELPAGHPRHPVRVVTGGGPVPAQLLARARGPDRRRPERVRRIRVRRGRGRVGRGARSLAVGGRLRPAGGDRRDRR
ncbi:MAG: hypothetical protein ABW203_08150 [Novosphingobium sp.]